MEFNDLIKKYNDLGKKYKLPEFEEMNGQFDIGRVERYSGNLLRDIRRIMMDRIVHYVRLIELMLNPASATPSFMILLREITPSDRKIMDKVFKEFVGLELKSFKMDVDSGEKDEAEFIKLVFKTWNGVKPSLYSLLAVMDRNWEKTDEKKEKGYFS